MKRKNSSAKAELERSLRTHTFNYKTVKDWHWYRVDWTVDVSEKERPEIFHFRSQLESFFNCMPIELPALINGRLLKILDFNRLGRHGSWDFWRRRPGDKDAVRLAVECGLLIPQKVKDYVRR